jgi:septal ring factor EnvC (AmiA/AmiB activator)
MRWLIVAAVASALFLVGWATGQKSQDEDVAKKLEALEKRLAETERKIGELERKLSEVNKKIAQLSTTRKFVLELLYPFVPRLLL